MAEKARIYLFILIVAAIVGVNLTVLPMVSFYIVGKLLIFLMPELRQGGESSLLLGGMGLWITPVVALLTFPLSYLLFMRLAVYLREKRGWEIRHPRRLFALSLALIFALPFLIWPL